MPYELNDSLEVAFHEAGHAIASWYLGVPFELVTIKPGKHIGGGRYRGALISHREYEIHPLEDDEDGIIRLLAGGLSEHMFLGCPFDRETPDMRKAIEKITFGLWEGHLMLDRPQMGDTRASVRTYKKQYLKRTHKKRNARLSYLLWETKRILRLNASNVELIASELLRKGTLSKKNVYSLLEAVALSTGAR